MIFFENFKAKDKGALNIPGSLNNANNTNKLEVDF